jgi:hypothetical protein
VSVTQAYAAEPQDGRRDFYPVGAAFFDPRVDHYEWYTGVGWIDHTERWAWVSGRHALFLRDGDLL